MGDAAEDLPEILTVEEAAKLLRVNVKTIYGAMRAGDAPWAKRVGRVVRINRSALMRWFEAENDQKRPRRDRLR